jgi:hypothetical protein
LTAGLFAVALLLLIGPAARRGFYQGWLRPRMVALGLLIVVLSIGMYVLRVAVVLAHH